MSSMREKWTLILLIITGLSLTFSIFQLVRDWEQERIRVDFENTASTFAAVFQSRIYDYLDDVDALKRLFDSSGIVSREVFAAFVAPVLSKKPEIQAFEWIPQVPAQQRQNHEKGAREQGLKKYRMVEKLNDGSMVPVSAREAYYPIFYMEPFSGNEAALGYDLGSSTVRQAALVQARDTADFVITGRITLVQETENQFGFLVFAPVFQMGADLLTVDARRTNFLGFVLGVFRVGASFEAATKDLSIDGMNVVVVDRSAPIKDQLLYSYNDGRQADGFPTSTQRDRPDDKPELHYTSELDVAGRTWAITLSALPEYLATHRQWQSWTVLFVGFIATLVLAIYINATHRRTAVIKALVDERTAQLREAQQELLRKERLAVLGQLTATVSHELRNPLGTIGSSLYLVRQKIDPDDAKLSEVINRIDRNVTRCDRIISEFSDFSRIKELNLQAITIDSWLTKLFENQTIRQGISLHWEKSIPNLIVSADPEELKQAILVVFDNACDAVLTGGGDISTIGDFQITVATRALNGRVEISITDTGPGITQDLLPKIFEPFFSTKNFGVGLGLTIANQIMKQHDGGIEVDSDPGCGTRVVLWLPLPHRSESF